MVMLEGIWQGCELEVAVGKQGFDLLFVSIYYVLSYWLCAYLLICWYMCRLCFYVLCCFAVYAVLNTRRA